MGRDHWKDRDRADVIGDPSGSRSQPDRFDLVPVRRPVAASNKVQDLARGWFYDWVDLEKLACLAFTLCIERIELNLRPRANLFIATAASRLMETLLGTPRSAHGSEYKPADFYAGLRHCPFVSKWWFSFAVPGFK
jgi:hypothetical protein